MWDENKIVSSINSPRFCLAVREARDGAAVTMHNRDTSPHLFTCGWVFHDGYIKPEGHQHLAIGLQGNKLVLQSANAESVINTWNAQALHRTTKPAASCHLGYQPISRRSIADSWTLENTVCVKKSADCTYYCVVGWGPGGYSGIQRISPTQRVAIFSMWNDHRNNVREIEHGPGVHVQTFGGEGTGMKSMKEINWKDNQKVTFRVSGKKVYNEEDNAYNTWRCTGMYSLDGHVWHLMATFERTGNPPFNGGFYSFVEDWRRDHYHEGHLIQREAEYSDPKLITGSGEVHHLKQAYFTRVDQGEDQFAHFKAFAAVKKSPSCFVLSTGGPTGADIFGSLAEEGYEQRTNHHYAHLNL